MTEQKTHWSLIALLWTTGLMAAAQFAKLTFTIEALQAYYPGMPVPLAVSGVSVVGILGGALAGFFVAKIGARKSILYAVSGSCALSLIQGLDMPFALFMATRIAEGFGHLLLVVALPTMMIMLAKHADKSVVMGLWGTFFGVGYAILALVVPVVEGWGGVHAVYVGHGLLLAAFLPVLWLALPRLDVSGQGIPGILAVHRAIYSSPKYLAPGLGHGIYTSIFIAVVAFLPDALDAVWLLPILPLSNLMGTFAAGFVARYIAASRLSVVGFAVAGVLFALMALTGSPLLAICAMFATGLTAGANFAAVPEFNHTADDQARANGAMAQIGNIGTFCGTPIYALVAGSLWGIAGVSIAICIAGVVVAGLAYRVARMSAETR